HDQEKREGGFGYKKSHSPIDRNPRPFFFKGQLHSIFSLSTTLHFHRCCSLSRQFLGFQFSTLQWLRVLCNSRVLTGGSDIEVGINRDSLRAAKDLCCSLRSNSIAKLRKLSVSTIH